MGIMWNSVKFLAQAKRDGVDFTRTLTIGRQNCFVKMAKVKVLLESYGLPHTLTPENMLHTPVYSEPVFMQLGAKVVDSVDASNYEGTTIVADLNQPIPTELAETYDLVYDGGSLEHVFNVRQSLANVMSLPRVGGNLIIHTMANNSFGHGFYQFSPELFYRVLTPENGYRVVRMVAHAAYDFAPWYEIPDPTEVRSRIELANPWEEIMLFIHARREASVDLFKTTPQQSDYSMRWQAPQKANEPSRIGLKRRMIESVKRNLPWAVLLKHHLMMKFPAVPRMMNGRLHRKNKKRQFSFAAHPKFFRRVE